MPKNIKKRIFFGIIIVMDCEVIFMLIVQICVGSSCYLKGSQEIVEKFEKAVKDHKLEDKVVLSGSFCTGSCNREGVTIHIDDKVFTKIKPENFDSFFEENVLSVVR